jgi:hypothetical protein
LPIGGSQNPVRVIVDPSIPGPEPPRLERGDADVSGIVTLDGKPLAKVMVGFMVEGVHYGYGCLSDENGRFLLPKMPSGEYRVRVMSTEDAPQSIPEKYGDDPKMSAFVVHLKDGQNEIKLELQSSGDAVKE